MTDWDFSIYFYIVGILAGLLVGGISFLFSKKKRRILTIISIIIILYFSVQAFIWNVKTTQKNLRENEYAVLVKEEMKLKQSSNT